MAPRMPKAGGGRVYVNQGVSFPPDLLKAAKERAARLGISLSQYMQLAVRAELARREPIMLDELPPLPPERKKR